MEILFVSHKYPPAVGGMEKQSFELIKGMQQFAVVHSIVYEGKGNRLLFFLTLRRKIIKTCRLHPGISVIHFNDGLLAAFCLWHWGYSHVMRTVTVHGLDVVFPNRLYRKWIIPKFNRFDGIFAVSQATAQACLERGVLPEKIAVVKNGVDGSPPFQQKAGERSNRFRWNQYGVDPRRQTLIVLMGRPVRRKGFSWFISRIVPQLKGDFQVLLIGAYSGKRLFRDRLVAALPSFISEPLQLLLGYPSDENRIRKLLLQPAIRQRVKHLGRLPGDSVSEVLAAAHAFAMPNIRVKGDMEGFGLVLLEASMAGVPVFASGLEGILDVVQDGRNGFLLPSEDEQAWTTTFNKLIEDPGHFKSRAEAFRQYTLQHFSWNRMVAAYYQHFIQLQQGLKE